MVVEVLIILAMGAESQVSKAAAARFGVGSIRTEASS